jgi:transposase
MCDTGNGFPTLGRHGQNERVVTLGRKAWLFAGSDRGGERAAAIYTIMQTAKLNDHNPENYLRDTLTKIAEGHRISRIDELMPWQPPTSS